jgi:DeoR/GlpR family transcriptional regulator of sugar metabolism
MLAAERRRRLLALVRGARAISVTALERRLGTSRMTIYRDLDALVADGVVERVHGGVVAVDGARPRAVADPSAKPLEERLDLARSAKRAIARHLARLLAGARTVVLDNSSTVYHLAEVLGGRDLFVVTGGVSLYLELKRRAPPGVRVGIHGGEPQERTGSLVGPLAVGSLGQMRFDVAVISCLGVLREEGTAFVSNDEEGEIKRLYLERARRRVLAVDRTKLGTSGPYVLASLDAFDDLVTEDGVEPLGRRASRARR